jgi:hypothetical protein
VDVRVAPRTLPLLPPWGLLVGELPCTVTLCLTADGSSLNFHLGSGFKIAVWRYPVGVDQGPVLVSKELHSVAWYGIHTFCFVLCVYESSGRAGQWSRTCILLESCCILPSNNKLLFVKLLLWA